MTEVRQAHDYCEVRLKPDPLRCTSAGWAVQVRPPSIVERRRPSASVTVASSAVDAVMANKSADSGKGARCHSRPPSLVRSTMPPRPTNQQISGEGALPAVSAAEMPVCCAAHDAPPSVERWTAEPGPTRQRTRGFGETISATVAARDTEDSASEAPARGFVESLARSWSAPRGAAALTAGDSAARASREGGGADPEA